MLQPSRWNTAAASWTWYRLHGCRTARSSLTTRAGRWDEAAWGTLAMNMQLPKLNSLSWQGTSLSFSLSPPLSQGYEIRTPSLQQFWSGLIAHGLLTSDHIQRWGWLCRSKAEKDSTCKYIIIYSLKAFILLQNKTGKICIAICNKRSKSLMWY